MKALEISTLLDTDSVLCKFSKLTKATTISISFITLRSKINFLDSFIKFYSSIGEVVL